MNIVLAVLSTVIAYLLGSIPFAYIIGKWRKVDVRRVGDKNVGTFNVFRHGGMAAGILTLVADVGKGALAIIAARLLSGNELVVFAAGIAAVIGHNWPVFLHFRGGRGLAVIIGALLALAPIEMLIAAAISLLVLYYTRNTIWFGVAIFVPLILLEIVFKERLSLIIYSVALPCLAGLAHLFTTRRLSSDQQKEAVTFWVGKAGRVKK
ncbi:MAG TPA: glycerol-3-phosphate acyltransferase [Dehalococcoidia bacterium]